MTRNDDAGPERPDDDEVRQFEITKWRTLSSVFQGNVAALIKTPALSAHFSRDYINNVGDRWRELQKIDFRLSVHLFSLVIFVGAIESGAVHTINLFGLRISSDNSSLAILVCISSLLMLSSTVVSMLTARYHAVINALSPNSATEAVRTYYILQFGWDFDALFAGTKSHDENLTAQKFVLALIGLLYTALLVAALIFIALEYYIFGRAIVFIFVHPQLPSYINLPIIVVAICSYLFSASGLLLHVPLPYRDLSSAQRLVDLEESHPDRAREVRMALAEKSLKRERRNVVVLQLVVVSITMFSLYLLAATWEIMPGYSMLLRVAIGNVVFGFVAAPLLDRYERSVILAWANIEDAQMRVQQYMRDKKRLVKIRLVAAAGVGGVLFLYFEIDRLLQALPSGVIGTS